ncbi:transposase [Azospirillum soli]|uniref:transposase n=1 Tax=Azospirillum soli TaxID=1304799 RepID=UPI001AE51DE7|nr:transposase [Azospirillum soli]MBP2316952.1 putative transposase [Azospirillum soli]
MKTLNTAALRSFLLKDYEITSNKSAPQRLLLKVSEEPQAARGTASYTRFARWTRLRLWRRLLDRLRRTWRLAYGDTAQPSAMVIDNRTCRSAPSCFVRGVDSGKKIRGVKVSIAVEKYGIPLVIDATPANVHDTTGIVPVLRQLVENSFQGPAIGDLGYRRQRLARTAAALGIAIQPIARSRDGVFIPTGIAWVVERSFSWITRHRRLNTIVERTKSTSSLSSIAFISILARRLKRLVIQDASA